MPLIDLVGMPIREAMLIVSDLRDTYGLHNRIRLIASGKLVNPADVAWAITAGADFVTSARGFMFALGCIQALKCNRNARSVINEVETIAHSVGVAEPRLMRRRHVRIVQPDGSSIPMNQIYRRSDPADHVLANKH
jgi:isopentenyl diphosphate isomerase/L-lactate dehydrogenase-like FMN-dependent dehydrogenase